MLSLDPTGRYFGRIENVVESLINKKIKVENSYENFKISD